MLLLENDLVDDVKNHLVRRYEQHLRLLSNLRSTSMEKSLAHQGLIEVDLLSRFPLLVELRPLLESLRARYP